MTFIVWHVSSIGINSRNKFSDNIKVWTVQQQCRKLIETIFRIIWRHRKIEREIKLHIDENVPAVSQHHRRIPFYMREKVEKELERLEKLDIIENIDGPTDWVSPIVVAPKKNGEIRICVDMRKANEAIKRERRNVLKYCSYWRPVKKTSCYIYSLIYCKNIHAQNNHTVYINVKAN